MPMTPIIMLWQAKCRFQGEDRRETDHVNLGGVANQQIVMNLAGVVSALLMITVVFSLFNPD